MASHVSQYNNTTLASRPVKDVYPVSRLVREARATLEGSFSMVWVEGEISNLAMPASGHIYFTLKDEVTQVRCAMFRNRNYHLRFTPQTGMQVLLRVKVTLYEGRGEFQLVVEHMEEAGSGALQRAYEALKYRLGQEGLFDQETKQTLPTMPNSIGIVSSPDGAAVHDILSVLNRRFPSVSIILYPVAVQGESSVEQIAEAINIANTRKECDVLIVGRGGGSLEDLWSFNDEKVAREIVACDIPVISAVGHETDFTIADFVADVRAPTPSAAAELAVPDADEFTLKLQGISQRLTVMINQKVYNDLRHIQYLCRRLPKPQTKLEFQQKQLGRLQQQLNRSHARVVQNKQQNLDYLTARIKHPQSRIDLQKQKLSNLQTRFWQAIQKKLQQDKFEFHVLRQKLASTIPLPLIQQQTEQLSQHQQQLHRLMQNRLMQHKMHLAQQMRTIAAVSPLNTLERGYSITTNSGTGNVLHKSNTVEPGQQVSIQLHQGQLECEVKKVKDD